MTVGCFVFLYNVTGRSVSQLGRVVDVLVVSTRNMIPGDDSIIEGTPPPGSSSMSLSEVDTRMPEQFVKLNAFKHLSSFLEGRTCLELVDDSEAYSTMSTGWQMVVQMDEYFWISSKAICDLTYVFPEKDVASGVFDDCRGMCNFFVVQHRFAHTNNRCISAVPPHSCSPFPENIQGFAEY